jgi:DNA modification methylase
LAIALQDDGWWVRADTIWHKPNPMPESVTDRPTKAHEYLYLLTKAEQYYYNAAAIAEPVVKGAAGSSFTHGKTGLNGLGRVGLGERVETGTRNKRSVWTVPTTPFPDAHFAVMPEALVEPCILAGSRLGDTVLDPFVGSGTVCAVATRLGRRSIGIDLNPAYLQMAEKRVLASCPEARGQLPLLEAI